MKYTFLIWLKTPINGKNYIIETVHCLTYVYAKWLLRRYISRADWWIVICQPHPVTV